MTVKNFAAAIDAAVSAGADQTTAKQGGGAFDIPAAGPCNLRLVAYIELGKHEKTFQGQKKVAEQVALTFELSGKNHPPVETDSGTFPHRITVTENLSLNEKARFFKLFQLLNYKGTAKHAAALLGEAFRGKVVHREYVGRDGKPRKIAELFDKKLGAYTITPPRIEAVDEDGQPTGEYRAVKVAEPLSDIRCFLWSHPDMDQWNSIFIEGQYEERKNEAGEVIAPARSKNQFQDKIASALNFEGSPIQALLHDGGVKLDLPADGVVDEDEGDEDTPAEAPAKPVAASKPAGGTQTRKPVTKAAKGDPLAGIAE